MKVLFFSFTRDRSFPVVVTLVLIGRAVFTTWGTMMRDFSAGLSETEALAAGKLLRSIGFVDLEAAAFIWLKRSFWLAAFWSQGIEHEQAAKAGHEIRTRTRSMRRKDRTEGMDFTIVTTVGVGGG